MYLMYVDESGSTGLDLENKNQPFFVLTGVHVSQNNWHPINDFFEQEKLKIYPNFKNIEIHATELFNSSPKSPFYNNYWKDNFKILEELVELISNLDIGLSCAVIDKKNYKKYFGNNILVDPYLYSFALLYKQFNDKLSEINDYGIVFCDELKNMEKSLEILYPRLNIDNKNIIEKTFYLNSKKNNFIQIADICSFYINKYNCIENKQFTMDNFKKEHCVKMYNKISKILGIKDENASFENFDFSNYFK